MTNQPRVQSYKDLIVWQKAMDLVVAVYELTEEFPREELYGLTSQMRRAAVSIPSNIAEGRVHGFRREYRHYLWGAYASGAELETQVEIAKRLAKTLDLNYAEVDAFLGKVMRMLNAMVNRMREVAEVGQNPKKLGS